MIASNYSSAAPGVDSTSRNASQPRTDQSAQHDRLIVDAPTRAFHWLFAACFLGAYASGDSDSWRAVHIALGYMMLALIGFRILYGLAGPRSMRLSALFRRAQGWSQWFRSLKPGNVHDGRAPQIQGLFTASVVLLLMIFSLLVFITGYATHLEWGGSFGTKAFEALHEFFADAFIATALAHIAGLALFSLLRLRNLARPMVTGRSRGAGPDLIRHERVWLAWTLTIGVSSFGVWQWTQVV